ncbi:hypothetical protein HK101_005016, partial [Irineochytrium annulatum]
MRRKTKRQLQQEVDDIWGSSSEDDCRVVLSPACSQSASGKSSRGAGSKRGTDGDKRDL